ncbi:hypothetical protein [Nonomuraea harbinensis]|uniref:Uncharacterized protein n=1 Tax=Nonomuraea harbinensis TaxID=1286938 RepID=A0ABW1BMH2_9ACTN|nr:hypothetical protein [Nonomuraea harbinensis]
MYADSTPNGARLRNSTSTAAATPAAIHHAASCRSGAAVRSPISSATANSPTTPATSQSTGEGIRGAMPEV